MSEIKNRKPTAEPDQKNVKKDIDKPKPKPKQKRPKIGFLTLIFAILFLLYEIANIIICFIMEFNRSKEIAKRSTTFLTFHIIFHLCVIIYDISLFLSAFKNVINFHASAMPFIAFFLFLISLAFYFGYLFATLIETNDCKNHITFNELQTILENTTITNVFFYSKGLVQTYQYSFNPAVGMQTRQSQFMKSYSKSSILLPLKSKQISERYHFLNTPKYFYFQIIPDLNMSSEFQTQYYETISKIRSCNNEEIKISFLPKINKTYIVGNPEMPKYLTHDYRNLAAYAGAGFYYDEYSKTIPFITYKPKIYLDVDPDFNFNELWANKWCKSYGQCDVNNPKPRPPIDDDNL